MEAITQKTRELWSSRTAFLLSAIGAAVGFGNVWRFPALAYEYGGGAFFLPYLLALFFIGIPFLVQEVAMGQHLRTSDVGVTNNISKHLRGVGVASLICGFVVVTYYVPLISWCLRALVESFFTDQWKGDSEVSSYDYFMQEIIGQMDDDIVRPTRILPANVLYLAITWTMVASCISFGIEWTGKIAYITMGLPILMLFILLVRSLTLPGAMNGLHEYIGTWDWSVLVEKPDVWSTAVSQIFFSIGVAVSRIFFLSSVTALVFKFVLIVFYTQYSLV
jgi:solute carrier family 6 GABA transporter-like protein 1